MREWRRCPVRGHDTLLTNEPLEPRPAVLPSGPCPLCQASIGPVIAQRKELRVVPNGRPWQRVEDLERVLEPGPLRRWEAPGAHEVIVEGHDHRVAWQDDELLVDSALLARERMLDLRRDQRLTDVVWFRQHGRAAGAKLAHPHSVIWATGAAPRWTERGCASCELLADERARGARAVAIQADAMAIASFAPVVDGEVWVLPRGHVGSLEVTSEAVVAAVAGCLARVLRALDRVLGTPAFTIGLRAAHGVPAAHWRFEVRPVLRVPDGLDALGRHRVHLAPEALARALVASDG